MEKNLIRIYETDEGELAYEVSPEVESKMVEVIGLMAILTNNFCSTFGNNEDETKQE